SRSSLSRTRLIASAEPLASASAAPEMADRASSQASKVSSTTGDLLLPLAPMAKTPLDNRSFGSRSRRPGRLPRRAALHATRHPSLAASGRVRRLPRRASTYSLVTPSPRQTLSFFLLGH